MMKFEHIDTQNAFVTATKELDNIIASNRFCPRGHYSEIYNYLRKYGGMDHEHHSDTNTYLSAVYSILSGTVVDECVVTTILYVLSSLYNLFNSLYLMSSSDRGYVMRVSSIGRKLYFGNQIIGVQPKAGSTVIVEVNETEGSNGNVIAGSITSGQRIYSQQNNETTVINYDVINPSPAYNGEDEEDLQEIRSNAIKSFVLFIASFFNWFYRP